MSDREPTDHLIAQGRALVRAIEALGTIEPTGPFERGFRNVSQSEIQLEGIEQ